MPSSDVRMKGKNDGPGSYLYSCSPLGKQNYEELVRIIHIQLAISYNTIQICGGNDSDNLGKQSNKSPLKIISTGEAAGAERNIRETDYARKIEGRERKVREGREGKEGREGREGRGGEGRAYCIHICHL